MSATKFGQAGWRGSSQEGYRFLGDSGAPWQSLLHNEMSIDKHIQSIISIERANDNIIRIV